MKKSLIAGASALALAVAAVPFGLASAADITTMTDALTITVEDSCTFDAASHAYTATMEANKLNENVGTTTMKVVCNDYQGYTVTGAFTALSGNGSNEIAYNDAAVAAGDGKWTAYSTPTIDGSAGTAAYLSDGGEVIKNSKQTIAAGDTASIVYKVATTNNQAAGTYEGAATYTLTKKTTN